MIPQNAFLQQMIENAGDFDVDLKLNTATSLLGGLWFYCSGNRHGQTFDDLWYVEIYFFGAKMHA